MHGLKIGHFSDHEHGTGLSVFLFESGAVGSYWICGSAPATHELAAIDPDNSVPNCHGLVLSGGSAFGLHAAGGVMRYLHEKGIGHPVPTGVVPIVPAAAIYDLTFKKVTYPTPEDAYNACLRATSEDNSRGSLGAGTGATVGKIIPKQHAMKSGIGRAEVSLANGVTVIAYVVANGVGDVRDHDKIIAGACDAAGKFANTEKYLLSGQGETELFTNTNTSLAAIFTNALLDKSTAKRIAKMASSGLARAISPVFTRYDGDIVFCISLGDQVVSELTLGTLAAEAVRLATVNSVMDSYILSLS